MIPWIALCTWPIVCIAVYQRTSLPMALCVTIIGGYLLLPNGVGIDLPLLPALNKASITTIVAFILTANAVNNARQPAVVLEGWMPRNRGAVVLLSILVLGNIGTVLTNQDPLVFGSVILPGLGLRDGISMLVTTILMLLPFLMARKVMATPEAHRILLTALAISALIYTIPMLYEIRMSPQLHRIVYGFHPSAFVQSVRAGGFRPTVFVNHGLALGIFMTFAVIAAAGLYRACLGQERKKWLAILVWLCLVLVLAKSFGALMIAIILVPVVLFCTVRTQLIVAACIAGMVLSYPALRTAGVIPIKQTLSFVERIDAQRAGSLIFRIEQEDRLLAKAQERPVFGWGIWGRSRLYDAEGRDVSVTDGAWIGTWGVGGWVGYIALFGLLCSPIFGLLFSRQTQTDPLAVVLAVILAGKLVDLIPNSGLSPIVWLMAGAMVGRLELGTQASVESATPLPAKKERASYTKSAPEGGSRYARAFPDKSKGKDRDKKEDPPSRRRPSLTRKANIASYHRSGHDRQK